MGVIFIGTDNAEENNNVDEDFKEINVINENNFPPSLTFASKARAWTSKAPFGTSLCGCSATNTLAYNTAV